jgi:heptosyltransferase-2
MRNADRSIGRAAVVTLAAFDLLASRLRKRGVTAGHEPGRILAIKLVGLGDTVLMLTPLKKVREAFPRAEISVLVTPLSTGILEGQPQVDRLIVHDMLRRDAGPSGLVRLVKRLRSYGFDLVIDFEQHFQMTAILAYLCGAKRRIGLYYTGNPRRRLFTDHVFFDPDRHMVDNYMRLLEPLGIRPDPVTVLEPVQVGAQDRGVAEAWLEDRRRHPERPLFGMHAGSGLRAPEKRWPSERFAEIIRRANAEYGAEVILTGDDDEAGLADSILKEAGVADAYNAAGCLSIKQTAALIGKCDLFISNDTGPMHIAASVGTPTLGLFGPEMPLRYGPVGERTSSIFKGVSCSPCVAIHRGKSENCGRGVCMEAISIEEVWNAVRRLYNVRAAR